MSGDIGECNVRQLRIQLRAHRGYDDACESDQRCLVHLVLSVLSRLYRHREKPCFSLCGLPATFTQRTNVYFLTLSFESHQKVNTTNPAFLFEVLSQMTPRLVYAGFDRGDSQPEPSSDFHLREALEFE